MDVTTVGVHGSTEFLRLFRPRHFGTSVLLGLEQRKTLLNWRGISSVNRGHLAEADHLDRRLRGWEWVNFELMSVNGTNSILGFKLESR